jgi:hypothetical protein
MIDPPLTTIIWDDDGRSLFRETFGNRPIP